MMGWGTPASPSPPPSSHKHYNQTALGGSARRGKQPGRQEHHTQPTRTQPESIAKTHQWPAAGRGALVQEAGSEGGGGIPQGRRMKARRGPQEPEAIDRFR